MLKGPLSPIHRPTPQEWAAMSGKAQWDIQVAMRGPDCTYPETVKWFSTAVLRGAMVNAFRVGGSVNADLRLIVLPDSSPTSLSGGWCADHFREHVRTAACHLGIPILLVAYEVWWGNRKKHGPVFVEAITLALQGLDSEHGAIEEFRRQAIEELRRHCQVLWGVPPCHV